MSQEIKDEIVLDSPLVVHKKSDASYQASASDIEMNETHQIDDKSTLERHRFKKDKNNKSNKKYIILLIVIVIIAVICALHFTGNLGSSDDETTTTTQATTESTTTLQQKYKDTIVVKDVYIFVDGEEVNGIEGLQDALKYKDASDTKYSIIKEHANTDFFNYDVLSILESLGFYSENTEIKTVQSTGLIAEAEITTEAPTTTTTLPVESTDSVSANG